MHAYDGHEEMRKRLRSLSQAEDAVRHREQQVSVREEVLNVALSAGIGPDLLQTSVGGGHHHRHNAHHDFGGGLLSVYDDDAGKRQDEMLVDLLVREAIAKVPPPPCVHAFLGVLEERAIEVETLYNSLLHDQERMQGKWRSLDRREREIHAREKQLLGWIGGVERVAGSLDIRTAETHNAAEKQAEEETELVVWSQTMREKESSLDERKEALDTLQRHLEEKSKQAEIAFQKAIQLQEEAAALRRESEGDQWRRRLTKLVVRSAQTDLTGAVVTDYEAIYERGGSVDPDALLNNNNNNNNSTEISLPILSSQRPFAADFTSPPPNRVARGVGQYPAISHTTSSTQAALPASSYRFRSPLSSSTVNKVIPPPSGGRSRGSVLDGWRDPLDSIIQDRSVAGHMNGTNHSSPSSSPPPPGVVDLRLRRSSTVDANHNRHVGGEGNGDVLNNTNEGGSYADFLGQDYFLGADAASGSSKAYRSRMKAEMSGVVSELEAEERLMRARAKKLPNRKDFLTSSTITERASGVHSTPTMIPNDGGAHQHQQQRTHSNLSSLSRGGVDDGGRRPSSSVQSTVDGSRRGSSSSRRESSASPLSNSHSHITNHTSSNRPDGRGSYPRKSPPPPPLQDDIPTDGYRHHQDNSTTNIRRNMDGDERATMPRSPIEISEHFAWPTPNVSHIPTASADDESRVHDHHDDDADGGGRGFAGGGFSRHGRVLPVPNKGGGLAAAYLPNSSTTSADQGGSNNENNNHHRYLQIPLLPDDGSESSGTPPLLHHGPSSSSSAPTAPRRKSSGGTDISSTDHPHHQPVVSSPTSRSVRFIEGPGMISSVVPPSPPTPSTSMSPQESDLYEPLPPNSSGGNNAHSVGGGSNTNTTTPIIDYGGYSVGGGGGGDHDNGDNPHGGHIASSGRHSYHQQPHYGYGAGGGGEDSSDGGSPIAAAGILRKRSATGPIFKGGLPPSARHHQQPPPPNPPSPQPVGDVMVDDPLGLGEPEYKLPTAAPTTRDAALDDPRRYLSQMHRSDALVPFQATAASSSSAGGQPPGGGGRRRSSTVTSW